LARSKWESVQSRFGEIEAWLKTGLSEQQIITNLGISKSTWESYKTKHPDLLELIKKGRAFQVSEVENALYKNATGYYYYVDELVKVKDPDGGEHVEKKRVQKFKCPETGAISFFLKNRDRENWADNPQGNELKKEEIKIRQRESSFKVW